MSRRGLERKVTETDSSKIREVGTLYPEFVFCLWGVTNLPWSRVLLKENGFNQTKTQGETPSYVEEVTQRILTSPWQDLPIPSHIKHPNPSDFTWAQGHRKFQFKGSLLIGETPGCWDIEVPKKSKVWALQAGNSVCGRTGHRELHTPARVQPLHWCWERMKNVWRGMWQTEWMSGLRLGPADTAQSPCARNSSRSRRSSRCPSALLHRFTAGSAPP